MGAARKNASAYAIRERRAHLENTAKCHHISKIRLNVKRVQWSLARRIFAAVGPSWYPATRLVMSFHVIVVMHALELRTQDRETVYAWPGPKQFWDILCSQHVYMITCLCSLQKEKSGGSRSGEPANMDQPIGTSQ